MGSEYLSVSLPGNVKELMDSIPEQRAFEIMRNSEFIADTELCGVYRDSDDEFLRGVFNDVKDSVSDLSHWPLHTIQGVSFYSMGGESWGDSPYEGFDLHLIAAEILSEAGLI
jgi:hypothetical protein